MSSRSVAIVICVVLNFTCGLAQAAQTHSLASENPVSCTSALPVMAKFAPALDKFSRSTRRRTESVKVAVSSATALVEEARTMFGLTKGLVFVQPELRSNFETSGRNVLALLGSEPLLNKFVELLVADLEILAGVQNIFGSESSLKEFDCLGDNSKKLFLDVETNPSVRSVSINDAGNLIPDIEAFKTSIQNVVDEEEILWGDTILEGEVGLVTGAKPEEVHLLVHDSTIFGYKIYITAPAVYTGDGCYYDHEIRMWVGECPEGSIYVWRTVDSKFNVIETGDVPEFDF